MSYHCPIGLEEYLALPRWERFELNHQLDALIDRMDSRSDPPRPVRKGGSLG